MKNQFMVLLLISVQALLNGQSGEISHEEFYIKNRNELPAELTIMISNATVDIMVAEKVKENDKTPLPYPVGKTPDTTKDMIKCVEIHKDEAGKESFSGTVYYYDKR